MHVLRTLRRCLSRGCSGTDSGFRTRQLYARGTDLGPADARGRTAADALSVLTMIDAAFFWVFAFMTLAGGILTISVRNAVHCAVWLIVSLQGTAGLFLLQ